MRRESHQRLLEAITESARNMSPHDIELSFNHPDGSKKWMQSIARPRTGPDGDIHSSGTHLLQIINDILDLSKVEAGKAELEEGNIDVGELVSRCMRIVDGRAKEGDLELQEDVQPDLPLLRCDETKLRQVLINLLSNSVKFTGPGGSVTLRVKYNDKTGFRFDVADTGVGMAPEEIPQALEPFRQVDSALSRRFEGTGLGLPLSRSLARLHGGNLTIISEPGKGTTCTVTLPPERAERRD